MYVQQNLLRDLKTEIQTARTSNEALKPTSSDNVVHDQMTHESEKSSLLMVVDLPKIQNVNTQSMIKEKVKAKTSWADICEAEEFSSQDFNVKLLKRMMLGGLLVV